MSHPAILKVQEFHDDLRDSDLSPAQQVLATAVDRITWGKVRDYQTANFVYGDLPRDYRAALIRADKHCEEALDMALEQYFLSLEDQDEVRGREWFCTKCKGKFESDQNRPHCKICGSGYVLPNCPNPVAIEMAVAEAMAEQSLADVVG